MDAVSQRRHIVVTGAHDDTCVRRYLRVQADKVAVIQRHHRSTRRSRKRYNGGVCDALGLPGLLHMG